MYWLIESETFLKHLAQYFHPRVRGLKGVDESAKLTGTVSYRVKNRIYNHVANRNVESFRLTLRLCIPKFFQRLRNISDISLPGNTKHLRACCQHLRLKKVMYRVL